MPAPPFEIWPVKSSRPSYRGPGYPTRNVRRCFNRVIVLVDLVGFVPTRDSGGHEGRHARLAVVVLVGARQPLPSSTGKVDDKGGCHESSNWTADLGFQVQNGLERRAKVLHPLNHVTLVDVVLIMKLESGHRHSDNVGWKGGDGLQEWCCCQQVGGWESTWSHSHHWRRGARRSGCGPWHHSHGASGWHPSWSTKSRWDCWSGCATPWTSRPSWPCWRCQWGHSPSHRTRPEHGLELQLVPLKQNGTAWCWACWSSARRSWSAAPAGGSMSHLQTPQCPGAQVDSRCRQKPPPNVCGSASAKPLLPCRYRLQPRKSGCRTCNRWDTRKLLFNITIRMGDNGVGRTKPGKTYAETELCLCTDALDPWPASRQSRGGSRAWVWGGPEAWSTSLARTAEQWGHGEDLASWRGSGCTAYPTLG